MSLISKINNSAGSYMMLVRFNEKDKEKCIINAGMVGTQPPSAEQIAAIEKEMPALPEQKAMELRIRYAETSIIIRDGQLLKDAEFELQE